MHALTPTQEINDIFLQFSNFAVKPLQFDRFFNEEYKNLIQLGIYPAKEIVSGDVKFMLVEKPNFKDKPVNFIISFHKGRTKFDEYTLERNDFRTLHPALVIRETQNGLNFCSRLRFEEPNNRRFCLIGIFRTSEKSTDLPLFLNSSICSKKEVNEVTHELFDYFEHLFQQRQQGQPRSEEEEDSEKQDFSRIDKLSFLFFLRKMKQIRSDFRKFFESRMLYLGQKEDHEHLHRNRHHSSSSDLSEQEKIEFLAFQNIPNGKMIKQVFLKHFPSLEYLTSMTIKAGEKQDSNPSHSSDIYFGSDFCNILHYTTAEERKKEYEDWKSKNLVSVQLNPLIRNLETKMIRIAKEEAKKMDEIIDRSVSVMEQTLKNKSKSSLKKFFKLLTKYQKLETRVKEIEIENKKRTESEEDECCVIL